MYVSKCPHDVLYYKVYVSLAHLQAFWGFSLHWRVPHNQGFKLAGFIRKPLTNQRVSTLKSDESVSAATRVYNVIPMTVPVYSNSTYIYECIYIYMNVWISLIFRTVGKD